MVECTGLENRRTLIAFPGFESLVSRQDSYESLAKAGLLCFWGMRKPRPKLRIVSASFQAVSATPTDSWSASWLYDLADPPVNRLRDVLVRVPQTAAGITEIQDFACCPWADLIGNTIGAYGSETVGGPIDSLGDKK